MWFFLSVKFATSLFVSLASGLSFLANFYKRPTISIISSFNFFNHAKELSSSELKRILLENSLNSKSIKNFFIFYSIFNCFSAFLNSQSKIFNFRGKALKLKLKQDRLRPVSRKIWRITRPRFAIRQKLAASRIIPA